MGSPISSIIAEVVMQQLEHVAMSQYRPKFWTRYVDDTFVVVKRTDKANFMGILNSVYADIKFTVEDEVRGAIAFLDVLLLRLPDGTVSTKVYRKPTHTDRILHYDSNHPVAHKAGCVRTLFGRVRSHCSTASAKMEETRHLYRTFQLNGYPLWFIRRHCAMRNNNDNPAEGPQERIVRVTLPYIHNVSEATARLLAPHNIKVAHRPDQTLRAKIMRPKDQLSIMDRSAVVYRVQCKDCPRNYVGETSKRLRTRIHEHRLAVKRGEPYSQVWSHMAESGHHFDWNQVRILANDSTKGGRLLKEAWFTGEDSINRHVDLCPAQRVLKAWHDGHPSVGKGFHQRRMDGGPFGAHGNSSSDARTVATDPEHLPDVDQDGPDWGDGARLDITKTSPRNMMDHRQLWIPPASSQPREDGGEGCQNNGLRPPPGRLKSWNPRAGKGTGCGTERANGKRAEENHNPPRIPGSEATPIQHFDKGYTRNHKMENEDAVGRRDVCCKRGGDISRSTHPMTTRLRHKKELSCQNQIGIALHGPPPYGEIDPCRLHTPPAPDHLGAHQNVKSLPRELDKYNPCDKGLPKMKKGELLDRSRKGGGASCSMHPMATRSRRGGERSSHHRAWIVTPMGPHPTPNEIDHPQPQMLTALGHLETHGNRRRLDGARKERGREEPRVSGLEQDDPYGGGFKHDIGIAAGERGTDIAWHGLSGGDEITAGRPVEEEQLPRDYRMECKDGIGWMSGRLEKKEVGGGELPGCLHREEERGKYVIKGDNECGFGRMETEKNNTNDVKEDRKARGGDTSIDPCSEGDWMDDTNRRGQSGGRRGKEPDRNDRKQHQGHRALECRNGKIDQAQSREISKGRGVLDPMPATPPTGMAYSGVQTRKMVRHHKEQQEKEDSDKTPEVVKRNNTPCGGTAKRHKKEAMSFEKGEGSFGDKTHSEVYRGPKGVIRMRVLPGTPNRQLGPLTRSRHRMQVKDIADAI